MHEHLVERDVFIAVPPAAVVDQQPRSDPWPQENLLGRPRRHPAGTILYYQGDALSALHLIADGVIKLVRSNAAGRTVAVGIRSAGWLLGAPSFLLTHAYPVSAVTLTDATVRTIDAGALAAARMSDPALNEWLLVLLARDVAKHLEAHDLTLLGARQRLLRMILSLAAACPPTLQSDGSYMIPVRLSHRDLADLLQTSRETATRLVNELDRASLARINRTMITIPPTSWLADRMQALPTPI